MTGQPCGACAEPIRRSTGLALCRPCFLISVEIFEAANTGAHPDVRQRAWSAFYGGKNPPAIAAVRARLAVAA